MELSLHDIAAKVNGTLTGDGSRKITGVAGLSDATEKDLSFVRDLKNAAALKQLAVTKAGVVLVPENLQQTAPCSTIAVKNPLDAFAAVLALVANETKPVVAAGRHAMSAVHSTAQIGARAAIGPFCTVDQGARIEDDVVLVSHVYVGPRSVVKKGTVLYPNVVLREDVSIGERCIIHAGAVIGADGYGFYYANGRHNKIPQVGTVVIEDDVEIGANATIDRATTGKTVVRRGAKLDNLVHIAHNVEIGPHSLLAAQVGVAGSTTIGAGAVFGGQVGVADHVNVGAGVQVGAQSGIKSDVEPNAVLFGSPAQPIQDTLKQHVLVRRLPDLFKEFKQLKEKLESYVGR
jgi:UDP-3-O-[3-hydroxymyristoyl] glucosamine N-acyltransferase